MARVGETTHKEIRAMGEIARHANSDVRRHGTRASFDEDARLRPIRLRPAGRNRIGRSRNWPKSKLAEVEQMVFALFLLFLLFLVFFSFFFFLFLFLLLLLSHLTLHFLFVLFLFLSPKTFALNP